MPTALCDMDIYSGTACLANVWGATGALSCTLYLSTLPSRRLNLLLFFVNVIHLHPPVMIDGKYEANSYMQPLI